jgi:hypothetical protein
MALKHGERHVVVRGDTMLVVKQVNCEWETKNAALQILRAEAEELLARFETWRVEWIPRQENRRTDEPGGRDEPEYEHARRRAGGPCESCGGSCGRRDQRGTDVPTASSNASASRLNGDDGDAGDAQRLMGSSSRISVRSNRRPTA